MGLSVYNRKSIWLYGNVALWKYGFNLWWFVASFRAERAFCEVNFAENGTNYLAFHFVLRGEQLGSKISFSGFESSSNYTQDAITTSRWERLTLFQHFYIYSTILRNRKKCYTRHSKSYKSRNTIISLGYLVPKHRRIPEKLILLQWRTNLVVTVNYIYSSNRWSQQTVSIVNMT